jgi:LCP family protein required for cell wall assembly
VRTTLKRGIGRGVPVNGNGRAVLPPGVLTPITRYRQPERLGRTIPALIGYAFVWLVAGLVSVFTALVGGYYLFLHEVPASLRPIDRQVLDAQKKLKIPVAGAPTTALVVGFDRRKGSESAINGSRSDTIMLLRADPRTDSISMMSFPRDLTVLNYCPGHTPVLDRINAAYSTCGARGTLDTVRQLTGLDINYLITVNFAGFKQVVDKLGGVWIDVDRRYFNHNVGTYGTNFADINLWPGYQKLNGQQALDYVRFRHTDSDLYRLARQQAFVKAMKEQISHSFLPISVPKVVGAIKRNHNVQIGVGGGKPIDFDTLKSYAFFAYRLPAGHLFQARIDGLTGTNELYASQTSIQDAVQQFLTPDTEAPAKATAIALGRKLRIATGPRPASVTILVLNGNGIPGSATTAGAQLHQRGYSLVLPANGRAANAPSWDYNRTKVYFDPRQAGARLAAKKVATLFGVADLGRIPAAIQAYANGAMLVVVVGASYHDILVPAPKDQTPRRQPPNVRNDPGTSVALLRPLRRRVPFRLMLPHVLERGSSPASDVSVRRYRIGKHWAVRLIYKTSADVAGYWGIEETNWDNAPILQNPNATTYRKGRRFDLYYSGPHLHVIVLREKDAVYWVSNTLTDVLSNETMLAIARGLQPMSR